MTTRRQILHQLQKHQQVKKQPKRSREQESAAWLAGCPDRTHGKVRNIVAACRCVAPSPCSKRSPQSTIKPSYQRHLIKDQRTGKTLDTPDKTRSSLGIARAGQICGRTRTRRRSATSSRELRARISNHASKIETEMPAVHKILHTDPPRRQVTPPACRRDPLSSRGVHVRASESSRQKVSSAPA